MVNGKKLKIFILKPRARQECIHSPHLLNIPLEVLVRAVGQEEGIRHIQIRKEEVNLFLFAQDIFFCRENPKDLTIKQLG